MLFSPQREGTSLSKAYTLESGQNSDPIYQGEPTTFFKHLQVVITGQQESYKVYIGEEN